MSEEDNDFIFRQVGWSPTLDLIQRLERVRLSLREDWRPIETFPEDGEEYLATDDRVLGGFPQVVYWDDGALKVPDASIAYSRGFFTHWMPLPAPPAALSRTPTTSGSGAGEELIAAYDEYIALLTKSESGALGIAHSHGYRCPDDLVQRGKELRERIASLKATPPPQPRAPGRG